MSELPDWYRVLRQWKNKGRTGLSFSFLVGATQEPIGASFSNEKDAKARSLALYESLKTERPEGCEAFVEDCGFAGGLVVKIGSPQGGSIPSFERLWRKYREAISKGYFSLTNGVAHPMADCEVEWVSQAFRN